VVVGATWFGEVLTLDINCDDNTSNEIISLFFSVLFPFTFSLLYHLYNLDHLASLV